MNLKMKVKQVYGKDMIYPDPGCAKSNLFAELLRKKTFDPKELTILVKLGYRITLDGHVPEDLKKVFDPKDLKKESFQTLDMWELPMEFISFEQPDNITVRGELCGVKLKDRIRSKMESGGVAVYEIIEIEYYKFTDRFFAKLIKLGYENGVFEEVKDEQK